MNPNLLYPESIKGRVTGRGIGIIDTVRLVEGARALQVLDGSPSLASEEGDGVKMWFAGYLDLWTTLRADSVVEELIRKFFIRQPVLWVD